ncbi:MAG: cation:dicarboxylase symporter family transporter [Planctomycetales bacterium]|nr:cation:dicarboxylase symporter family transporter [Planctomycetales bacterium]
MVKRYNQLSTWIMAGLFSGIVVGLFLGDLCEPLKVVGDAFVGLLRMAVLPYIVVALIAGFGRMSLLQSRRFAWCGGLVLLGLWAIGLLSVYILPHSFPTWNTGSFFSASLLEPPESIDFVSLFVPANVFRALAEDYIPAVVLFSVALGLAIGSLPNRDLLVTQLDLLSQALTRVSAWVVNLTPVGIFAISAHSAGTMSWAETSRLQAYLVTYTVGTVVIVLGVLPALICSVTDYSYREIMRVTRDSMLTAFATGKLLVVLPILISQTNRLVREKHDSQSTGGNTGRFDPNQVDALVTTAYPFPHIGKLMGMLFIPFAAWFLGRPMVDAEYPGFLVVGLFSYFGGPLVATPALLDQMHLPHDMFQLFLVSGIYCGRLGDVVGVMHLTAFTLITSTALNGRLKWSFWLAAQWGVLTVLIFLAFSIGLRLTLKQTVANMEDREDLIANLQLLEQPVPAKILKQASPNPSPLQPGESLLRRIRRRDVIRIGYNSDKLPFAYFNIRGELVGLDINMAHVLARDLGVSIEFVPYDPQQLRRQIADDCFDVVMSGLVGTLDRSVSIPHTSSYLDVTLGLVAEDFRADDFRTLQQMRTLRDLQIGYVDISRSTLDQYRKVLPDAEFYSISESHRFFESANQLGLDALLINAESGSAYTLFYPSFEVIIPQDLKISMPLFYAIGNRDAEMREFLEHWIHLRTKDGTYRVNYEYWVLGKSQRPAQRRWSIIRNVLGWVP